MRISIASLCLTTALTACLAAPAYAQDVGVAVGEIMVTARRTTERLQEVPISITVYNQQQLADRNVVSATDLSTYTPSLSANPRYGTENASIAIRGFTQELGTSPSVGIYFADVVSPRANGGTVAGNGAGAGAWFDLQNVQVLKGPQGTLFGRNTTGGAVLLVPQKPTSAFGGYLEGSVGNYDLRRIQGAVNLPLNENIRLRVSADHQEREGYLKSRSGIGPKDFNDVDYTAVRVSLVADLTPDLENYTIASYTDSDTHGMLPRMTVCNTAPLGTAARILAPFGCAQVARQNARGDGYYDVDNSSPHARQHARQKQIINTTTWIVSPTTTIKNIVSYAEFWQSQAASIMGDNFTLANGAPFNYVRLAPFPGAHNVQQKTLTEELQFQGRTTDERVNWQTGIYYEKSNPLHGFQTSMSPSFLSCTDLENYKCSDPFSALAGGRPFGNINISATEYHFRNLGMYAQATYKLTDAFSLTGGFRYTSDRTTGIGENVGVIFPAPNTPAFICRNTLVFPNTRVADPKVAEPTACRLARTAKSAKPTWLIDLDYKPNDDILVYAKYARGYRQGSVNTSNVGFETWEPEKVDSYEVGAKTSFRGVVSGTFNVAAFYNDLNEQQLQGNAIGVPPFVGAAVIVNAGKSRIAGLEVDASINLTEDLNVSVGYAYLDTKLKSFTAPPLPSSYASISPAAILGGALAYTPKNKLTVTGTYNLPIDEKIGRVSVAANFTHTDKQIATSGTPIGVLPATDLLNLNLNWSEIGGRPIDLALFATNVTKEKYPVSVAGSWGSTGFDSYIVGQPRMYGARVRVRFGN